MILKYILIIAGVIFFLYYLGVGLIGATVSESALYYTSYGYNNALTKLEIAQIKANMDKWSEHTKSTSETHLPPKTDDYETTWEYFAGMAPTSLLFIGAIIMMKKEFQNKLYIAATIIIYLAVDISLNIYLWYNALLCDISSSSYKTSNMYPSGSIYADECYNHMFYSVNIQGWMANGAMRGIFYFFCTIKLIFWIFLGIIPVNSLIMYTLTRVESQGSSKSELEVELSSESESEYVRRKKIIYDKKKRKKYDSKRRRKSEDKIKRQSRATKSQALKHKMRYVPTKSLSPNIARSTKIQSKSKHASNIAISTKSQSKSKHASNVATSTKRQPKSKDASNKEMVFYNGVWQEISMEYPDKSQSKSKHASNIPISTKSQSKSKHASNVATSTKRQSKSKDASNKELVFYNGIWQEISMEYPDNTTDTKKQPNSVNANKSEEIYYDGSWHEI